jgi:oxygen-dependent protoporphyrinogen oxidase
VSGGRLDRVVVVGGGISGLTAAYRLVRRANGRPLDLTLLEASDRLGGKLLTTTVDGIPIEAGADSFVVRKPWAVDLCKELGLGGELVVPAARGAFVWARGRLIRLPERSAFGVPASIGQILRCPGLSAQGRVRAATEFLRRPRRGGDDESLGALLERRLGPEAARVLVEPLLAGLYAGDPAQLSVRATFPELVAWEQGHDSLIRGARAALRAARRAEAAGEDAGGIRERAAIFASVWGGLGRLVDTLEAAIGPARIRRRTQARAIRRDLSGRSYLVSTEEEEIAADAVVLAAPAFESARLLRELNWRAASALSTIAHASTAVVLLVYPEGTGGALPAGTGFVVPTGGGDITACTWMSRKWPLEDNSSRAILRCFVGRAGDERTLARSDDDLIGVAHRDVDRATGIGVEPTSAMVVRWPRSMPQYDVGHLGRLAEIEDALATSPGLFLAGSAYRGIGIADCVRQGGQAASRVREYLREPASVKASGSSQ